MSNIIQTIKETIREAANSTHEIIEYLFSEENVSDGESIDPTVRLANRLRELALRLESTVGDVVDYIKGNDPISSVTDSPDVSSSSRSAITSSKDDDVVGFEEDVKVIKNRLCEGSFRLQVIPIVGTGGIGKTTLAKILYNDSLIRKEFSICGWVTISQDHSVERIVSNLLASIKEISALRDAKSDIPIETLICEYLKGRRYLIVMDDMWSKKAWDDVKMLFPDTRNGSRIIVTTRLHDVAAYVDSSRSIHTMSLLAAYVYSSSSIHTMSLLDSHQSWNLLKRKVFGYKDIPIELEGIGFKIAKNCGGLPLSIVVVAGLLSKITIYTRDSWKQIAANSGQLETIICLSYTHLPNHSKPCLLYMAGFPEDYEIGVSELIHLWISEGFVTLSNGSQSLEEEAEDFMEDLVERSLVLVTNRKSDGKIKSCGLHDIVREFLVRQAAKEKVLSLAMDFVCSKRMVEMIPNIKKLGLCYSKEKSDADAGYRLNNLKYLCRLEKLKLEMPEGSLSRQQYDEMTLGMRGGFSFRLVDKILGWISFRLVDKILGWIPFRQADKILGGIPFRQADKILGGINFPLQLRRLTLSGWKLPSSDMTIIGSLPNLQVLKLRNFKRIDWVTSNGKFRELRLLLIDRSYLSDWKTEASHFPRLECLMLHGCLGLPEIPSNIGDIPTLKLIEVDEQSTRLLLSAEKIQKKQWDSRKCNFLVRVKRSCYICCSFKSRAVFKYLQSAFTKEAECGRNALSLDNLLIGKSRKEASRMFFETLVLKTRDYIHVEERIPFGDITIRPRTILIKSDF